MITAYLALPVALPPRASADVLAMSFEALAGDGLAAATFRDWAEETECVNDYPFKVGDKVFFFQVTLYYVGEIVEIGRGWVRLKDASWVHWTGRVSSLFRSYDLSGLHGGRRPRVEFLGDHTVYLHATVGSKPWLGELPKEALP